MVGALKGVAWTGPTAREKPTCLAGKAAATTAPTVEVNPDFYENCSNVNSIE